ncbi:MAG: epoxyqueuosine reductase QueH [Treponema sp.]|jgi:predicted adenine nucleotide alpha hydrolase (AANH) superfamily ATPase|nr:epoxyqueuosine reductase QueH [Treponema sp.]
MKVLLHCCCAPCTIECAGLLLDEGYGPDLFWYNPNIHPFTEYKSRRDALTAYAKTADLSLQMVDEYGLRPFLRAVRDAAVRQEFDDDPDAAPDAVPGRCARCYRMRLEKTAAHAAGGGYDAFSTTLLISPYQRHELIVRTAEEAAEKHGVPFLYRDFRPRFREGQAKARELGFYMQKYCGCIFSEEERYLPPPGGKTVPQKTERSP